MWSSDLVQRALRVAAQAHKVQQFSGTDLPYLLHVMQVATEVMAVAGEPGTDSTLAVLCAVLHDTLEDTTLTEAELEAEFGLAVLAGVKALTKNEKLPKSERMADSVRRILEQPPQVAWVKLADRITNLQTPPSHWDSKKIRAYRAEARVIFTALGHHEPTLAARLEAKIATYAPETPETPSV